MNDIKISLGKDKSSVEAPNEYADKPRKRKEVYQPRFEKNWHRTGHVIKITRTPVTIASQGVA